jgi:hypothetical protein
MGTEKIKRDSYRKVLNTATTLNDLQKIWKDVAYYFSNYIKDNNLGNSNLEAEAKIVLEDSTKRLESFPS